MELQEMKSFLKRKWQTLVLFMLAFGLLAFVFSVLQPQKYRSEQRFLVVATYGDAVDPYAATQSTEYLTNLLSQVMYSQDFLDRVLHSGYALDESLFPQDAKKRQKAWNKTISARVLGNTGILDVTVYNKNRFVTEQLALAVGDVLRSQNAQYHSRGDSVRIQTIDAPITSNTPVDPNIPLNTGIGLALGLIFGLASVYLFPKMEWNFLRKRQKHKLVQPKQPGWSKLIAAPQAKQEDTARPRLYEHAELKFPTRRAGKEQTPEREDEAPTNLPIA